MWRITEGSLVRLKPPVSPKRLGAKAGTLPKLRSCHESRLDIHRDAGEALEDTLYGRPNNCQLRNHLFRRRVVADRLHRHDVPGQIDDVLLDAAGTDREGAVGGNGDAAMIQEVIELHCDAAAVCLVQPETN